MLNFLHIQVSQYCWLAAAGKDLTPIKYIQEEDEYRRRRGKNCRKKTVEFEIFCTRSVHTRNTKASGHAARLRQRNEKRLKKSFPVNDVRDTHDMYCKDS